MSGSEVPFVRAIRGPLTLITVGVLFALNNFTAYHFGQTWPVLLIVFGLLSLLGRGTENIPRSPGPGRPGFPPSSFPPPDTSTGGYRQSSYTAASSPAGTESSSGPAKGGFGSSAPPRSTDPGPTPPSGDTI